MKRFTKAIMAAVTGMAMAGTVFADEVINDVGDGRNNKVNVGPDGKKDTVIVNDSGDGRNNKINITPDKGDKVMLLAKNRIECVESFFACAKIGAVYAPINWRFAPAEVEYVLSGYAPTLAAAHQAAADRQSGCGDNAVHMVATVPPLPTPAAATSTVEKPDASATVPAVHISSVGSASDSPPAAAGQGNKEK